MAKIIVDNYLEQHIIEFQHILNVNEIEFVVESSNSSGEEQNNIKGENGYILIDVLKQPDVKAVLMRAEDLKYPLPDGIDMYALIQHKNDEFALVGLKEESEFKEKISRFDVRKKRGKVVLAGFGPGDHWLITKKTEYSLHMADVIFYDDLINQEYLNRFSANKYYVGKRKGAHKFDQEKINELLYKEALKGKQVVRLKGGDPLIFGRGAEEYHYLKSRFVDVEIIPGITSASAAAASAIIPLTERSLSSSVVFLSGHDLNKLRIPKAETLVFYMGATQQRALATRIIEEGWHPDTPVGIVHDASRQNQQVYRGTLRKLKEKESGLPSPSIIIVGKTAMNYDPKPNKWLYTGLSVNDWEMDENIVHTPLISISSVSAKEEEKHILKNLKSYDRLIFTSRYGVQYFFEMLFENGLDSRELHGIQIDSVGHITSQALKEKGLLVKPLTKVESSDAMLSYYSRNNVVNERIIVPGSGSGSINLRKGLFEIGNVVTTLSVYNTIENKAIVKQNLDMFKGVIFTSPQTINIFKKIYGGIPNHLKIKTRGSQTKRILEEYLKEEKSGNKEIEKNGDCIKKNPCLQ